MSVTFHETISIFQKLVVFYGFLVFWVTLFCMIQLM